MFDQEGWMIRMTILFLLSISFPALAEVIATPANVGINYGRLPEPFESDCKGIRAGTYSSGNIVEFMNACIARGISEGFCNNLTHPNSQSIHEFRCTYPGKPHILIPPDKTKWEHAFKGATLVQNGIKNNELCVEEIYNWYRPEPYNDNVDGKPGRHPEGTAIDVRFCTKEDAKKAAKYFCEQFKAGALWAVGSYPSGDKLHLGMEPEKNTTWGPYACSN
jgi:hypothetical protein